VYMDDSGGRFGYQPAVRPRPQVGILAERGVLVVARERLGESTRVDSERPGPYPQP
jgi:hypothetical protein